MSGDDSDGWAHEEERMEDLIATQNKAEEEAAEQEQEDVPQLVLSGSWQRKQTRQQ
jgi:Spy/CpxP family protein refolding chaperone